MVAGSWVVVMGEVVVTDSVVVVGGAVVVGGGSTVVRTNSTSMHSLCNYDQHTNIDEEVHCRSTSVRYFTTKLSCWLCRDS